MRTSKPRFFNQLPETVEAVQWQPGRHPAGIVMELPPSPGTATLLPLPAHAILHTQLGRFTVFADDWIVTEPTGDRYVMSNERFARHYVAVEGQEGLFVPQEIHAESDHTEE